MAIHLIREIDKLKKMIIHLSDLVEKNIKATMKAVMENDPELAQKVIKRDEDIDSMEIEIEEECLKTFALYQPVANDLRFIVAILKVNNDMERIGDLAANIAKAAIFLQDFEVKSCLQELEFELTASKALNMFKKSFDSLLSLDAKVALDVCQSDDEVDDLVHKAHKKIQKYMVASPDHIEYLLRILYIFRHLERIADLSTNVAEDTVYLKEGNIIRHGNDIE